MISNQLDSAVTDRMRQESVIESWTYVIRSYYYGPQRFVVHSPRGVIHRKTKTGSWEPLQGAYSGEPLRAGSTRESFAKACERYWETFMSYQRKHGHRE